MQAVVTENFCPYCNLASKTGELFCSIHHADMKHLDSGIFYIRQRAFEACDWHLTRLSINFNFDSTQPYWTTSRSFNVSPEKYLLINEGQSFKTAAHGEQEQRMVTIAFKSGLARQIYDSLSSGEKFLVDNAGDEPLNFFEQTYPIDEVLRRAVLELISGNSPAIDREELSEKLEAMLAHLVSLQHDLYRRIASISKAKTSTRIEVYRRLQWAMEYLQDNYCTPIAVDDLAAEACLSTFHFKRLFREFYHEPPYRYIRRLRLERSTVLLRQGMPVHEVCKNVGWEDPSSFIRLFRNAFGVTPNSYRSRAVRR